MKFILFASFSFLLFSSHSQLTIKMKPDSLKGKDAVVASPVNFSNYSITNFGKQHAFNIGAWTWNGEAGVIRGLFDFNWSVLPPNAVISNSTIKFYAFNGENGQQEFHSELSGSNESWIERIISPWGEHEVTYVTSPATSVNNRISVLSSDSSNQDFLIDITSLVQDIMLDPQNSYGFSWKLQNENYYRRLGFCSSDISDPSKRPEISITFDAPGVMGIVFQETNSNCSQDNNEYGLTNRLVQIQPGNYIAQTNDAGLWHLNLPLGDYTATLLSNDVNWSNNCAESYNFTVTDINASLIVPAFGLTSTDSCSLPNISIYSNIIRRCFSEQEIYVSASNSYLATGPINDAYAEITLDPLFTLDSATIAFTSLGNNLFRFELDTLTPDETVNFTLYVTLSCDAVLLETLCHEAQLFPSEDCNIDTTANPSLPMVSPCTLPWDHSSLSVDGFCANDSIYFTITNTGELGGGDMQCYAPVRVFIDGVLTIIDSILLLGGETITYSFAGTGQTWILQADQHPLHPGNSHPNAHVENCGSGTWTPGGINDLPLDDADPVVDIFCTVTNGAYDPNDKRGFPNGITENNFISANQDLEYIIRFQNTGTDTAFTVVVRDTLDTDLDINSITLGASSHNYSFKIYGPRVLEWTFNNILLVDSTTNEPGSHGFIQFTVSQTPNLPVGTVIANEADIYFDFNVPVITNNTIHIINEDVFWKQNDITSIDKGTFQIFPNPTQNIINIVSLNKNEILHYEMIDISGKIVLVGKFNSQKNKQIDLNNLKSGIYILNLYDKNSSEQIKVVKH